MCKVTDVCGYHTSIRTKSPFIGKLFPHNRMSRSRPHLRPTSVTTRGTDVSTLFLSRTGCSAVASNWNRLDEAMMATASSMTERSHAGERAMRRDETRSPPGTHRSGRVMYLRDNVKRLTRRLHHLIHCCCKQHHLVVDPDVRKSLNNHHSEFLA